MTEPSNVAQIKKRYSKTRSSFYYSNGCKFCDAIMGEKYLIDELSDFLYANPRPILKVPFVLNEQKPEDYEQELGDYEHWCIKGSEGFCEI